MSNKIWKLSCSACDKRTYHIVTKGAQGINIKNVRGGNAYFKYCMECGKRTLNVVPDAEYTVMIEFEETDHDRD